MKKCPNCNAQIADDSRFCTECGKPIPQVNGCPYCGASVNESDTFCRNCGNRIESDYLEEPNKAKRVTQKKKILPLVLSFLVLAILCGGFWYFNSKSNEDTPISIQNDYSLEGLAKAVGNYDKIDNFYDGRARVVKGDKYGFIDKMGNEVVPCIYCSNNPFSDLRFHNGLALVSKEDNNANSFFINREGKEAFTFQYDAVYNFSEGLALVYKDGKSGYIDTKGNEVIALSDKYSCGFFSDGMAPVAKDMKLGFIDKSGNLVIPINIDFSPIAFMGWMDGFHDGMFLVYVNDKYGYLDKSGKQVIPCVYESASAFSEGFAAVCKDGKFGYIDKEGKVVIPCIYEYAYSFKEGLAAVKKHGKWGFVDKDGKEVIPYIFEEANVFSEGLAAVKKHGKWGFVDKDGKEVIPHIFEEANVFSEGLAVVEKDGVYGYVDKKGNSTIDIDVHQRAAENNADNSDKTIQEMTQYLESFYENYVSISGEYNEEFVRDNVTDNALKVLKRHYTRGEGGDMAYPNGIALWLFRFYNGWVSPGNLISRTITPLDKNKFLVVSKYTEIDRYEVELTVIKEGNSYKIDDIWSKVAEEAEEDTYDNSNHQEQDNYDWLQGHWVYEQSNYEGHFIIQGDIIIQYSSMNPEHDEATFRIEEGAIRARLIDGMDLVVPIDFANQRIDYGDGCWMHKVYE